MNGDKIRWNQKYRDCPMPSDVAAIVKEYCDLAPIGQALDIACGTGRNTLYMAEKGFHVDALDISDYALSQIVDHALINKMEVDLDQYIIPKGRYDLIVNCNFLDRHHFNMLPSALKTSGVLIYETFVEADGEGFHQPSNPDFLLRKNELLNAFDTLDVIHYLEEERLNLRGERVMVASFVGRKGF